MSKNTIVGLLLIILPVVAFSAVMYFYIDPEYFAITFKVCLAFFAAAAGIVSIAIGIDKLTG